MRVVHVLASLNTGGAELRTLETARALSARGVQFTFVTTLGIAGEHAPAAAAIGAQVVPMRLGRRFPWRFMRLLRDVRPDVVHTHISTASALIVVLAWLSGVPVRIAHASSDSDGITAGPVRRADLALRRWLIRTFATGVIGQTGEAVRFVTGLPEPRPEVDVVRPRGFDTSRLRAVDWSVRPQGAMRILVVGRDDPAKNWDRLPSILQAVRDVEPNARMTVVGLHQHRLPALFRAAGVADAVDLVGTDNDVFGWYLRSDVLLFPSVREGMPGVVVEACAVGLPVVASDLPGIRHIDEVLGGVRLLSPRRSDVDWARAVIEAARGARVGIEQRRAEAVERIERSTLAQHHVIPALFAIYAGSGRSRSYRRRAMTNAPAKSAD